jgi:hypothetical protein
VTIKLSKSRFIAGCQCLKRLYLQVHPPELAAEPDSADQAIIEQGREVGMLARTLFPGGVAVRNRYHPPHQFELLVSTIASDMGHEYIDSERLVRRNYDKWAQSLRAFSSEYVFEIEARKLIENAILADLSNLMPITGEDVIREFNLEPGKLVGRLLGEARELYQRTPCTRTELIDRLRPIAAALHKN